MISPVEVNGAVTVKERYGDNPKRVAPLTSGGHTADIPPQRRRFASMKHGGNPFALALVFSVTASAWFMLIAPSCRRSRNSTPTIWRVATASITRVFMRHRGPAGAAAENVAVGCDTEACARRMWMQSPAHRANMMLGGCQAVASAVSASGRRYWAMEIGGRGGGGGGRGGRGGRGGDGIPGRDFSIEGANAPYLSTTKEAGLTAFL